MWLIFPDDGVVAFFLGLLDMLVRENTDLSLITKCSLVTSEEASGIHTALLIHVREFSIQP